MNEAELFWLRVFLSFIIGGTWLMLISVIAERKGTKLGGLLGGLPHTVLVALLFIGINQGADFAAESAASTVVPFIVNPFFLWLLATKARQSLKIALLLAATFRLAAMVVVRGLQLTDIWVNLVIWLAGMVVLLVRFQRILPVNDVKGAAVSFTKRQLTMRAVFAGVIIASAVIGGKYGGSVLGYLSWVPSRLPLDICHCILFPWPTICAIFCTHTYAQRSHNSYCVRRGRPFPIPHSGLVVGYAHSLWHQSWVYAICSGATRCSPEPLCYNERMNEAVLTGLGLLSGLLMAVCGVPYIRDIFCAQNQARTSYVVGVAWAWHHGHHCAVPSRGYVVGRDDYSQCYGLWNHCIFVFAIWLWRV